MFSVGFLSKFVWERERGKTHLQGKESFIVVGEFLQGVTLMILVIMTA